MVDFNLAQLEHVSQLLIFQIKNANQLIAKAWYELELVRVDIKELMEIHEKWEKEMGLNQEPEE